MRSLAIVVAAAGVLPAQLFQGLEGTLPIRSTSLAGFPNVTFTSHTTFEVNGMAALGDGRTLVIAKGPFTTDLFRSDRGATPQSWMRAGIDLHGLGYGRDKLFGFSNFGSPMGIYEIDTTTGAATLALSTATSGLRFFALDYNPVDDLLYGYSEYGNSGLYAIDVDAGTATRIAGSIPATNTQGRGMAVGNHVVYLTATRGDDNIPSFAYDLRQGMNGTWTGFTNPYPADHATGGSAFNSVVQTWAGFRGPGRVTLSATGDALATGGRATLRIATPLANATGFLVLSTSSNPTAVPGLGATIAAYPPVAFAAVTVDARGLLEAPLAGGGGPAVVWGQVLLQDQSQPRGWAVSNALRVAFQP